MNAVVKRWTDLRGANGRNGAGKRNRTSDLLITNQLLYRLSYSGVKAPQYKSRVQAKQVDPCAPRPTYVNSVMRRGPHA